MIEKVKHFITEALWRMELTGQPLWVRILIHPLRFLLLTVRTYLRDESMLHASALTYITMLAIVPVLALGITTLKSFGAGEMAQTKIVEYIDSFAEQVAAGSETASHPTVTASPQQGTVPVVAPAQTADAEDSAALLAEELRGLTDKVFKQIEAINFAQIGVVGAIFLIFMVITVLGKIENSFNMIWGVQKPRPLWRKCTDYLSVIIVVPMLMLAATSFPILDSINTFNPQAGKFVSFIADLGISKFLVPLTISTVLFAFLFGFLPNTKIKISSCFIGGFFTSIFIAIFFKLCMVMQIGIANNSVVYGSLIALPILLFWILSSWQIIIFGAEICYVHQYYSTLVKESAFSHPSERDKITVALALVLRTAQSVQEDNTPLIADKFAEAFTLPPRFVRTVAGILERNHILATVITSDDEETAYLLSRCATQLSVSDVINACLDDTAGEAVECRVPPTDTLQQILSKFNVALTDAFNVSIADLLTRQVPDAQK